MKKIIAAALALCVGVSFFVLAVQGGVRIPPRPWEVEFEEHDRIFIVTPTPGQPFFADEYAGWNSWVESQSEWQEPSHDKERWRLRSGLYYHTDPLTNIYYVDEYFYEGSLFFSSDGRYFAQVNGMITTGTYGKLDGEAIRFFADGEFATSYQVGDLVRRRDQHSGIAVTSAGLLWMEWDTIEHNQQAATLSLVTRDGRAYTFDITTGEIISQVNRCLTVIVFVAAAIALITAIIFFVRYKRRIFRDRKQPPCH
ncbi:MAG: hypothetical protein FWE19_05885 [Oscillospiraceae bacterium]|nr:hypothetical protein [Oscillospiraceae bacterium]